MMTFKRTIAFQLKAIRKQLGVTQGGLAEVFNNTEPKDLTTTRSDISHYEMGTITIPATKYLKMLMLTDQYKWLLEAYKPE